MSIDAILADEVFLRWLFLGSLVSFLAALIIIPIIVVELPAEYFRRPNTSGFSWPDRHPLIWVPLLVAKNAAAVACLVLGSAMLLLPGQGILTIVVGLLLLDFPGKYRTERWIMKRTWILRLFNRIRIRAGKGPFVI